MPRIDKKENIAMESITDIIRIMSNLPDIDLMVAAMRDEMVRLRRDFHAHPELGFKEKRTSGIIAGYLKGLGMEVREGIAKTGVTGLLKGASPGRTVMLRADMDALPIQEKSEAPYRSVNAGVMHACGHDGHMAILLGAAAVLSEQREHIQGQIKFVFQPAEERIGGARCMIEEGVLEDPHVDAAFALHIFSAIPTGTLCWSKGIMMAAMDSFTLRIKGKGGHSSMPEEGVDAIRAGARVVTGLQSLNACDASRPRSSLINIGTIRGGDANNVIAEEVELTGTVRTLDSHTRAGFPAAMVGVIRKIADEMKASFELDYEHGYPPLVNDPDMTGLLIEIAGSMPLVTDLIEMPPVMASEDMAFYLERVPGCFFFLGAGSPGKGLNKLLHTSDFDFDENAMTVGATILSKSALSFLDKESPKQGASSRLHEIDEA